MRRNGWVRTSITPTDGVRNNSLVSIPGDAYVYVQMDGQIERMRDRTHSVPAVMALRKNDVLIEKVFDTFQQILIDRSRTTLLPPWFSVISFTKRLIIF